MSAALGTRPSIYATAVGKKYAMAVSGFILMGFVLLHMVGNLKFYLGQSALDTYSEWLREIGEPALPRATMLWAARILLLGAVGVHIHAAVALTRINRRARPEAYRSKRDYVAADFASRTMRWTGIIVALFVVWHLLDLTWGTANPDFQSGNPYHNVIASFERWPVAIAYVIANLALGLHLYHGVWSMFQSVGLVFPRRRELAVAFAAVVAIGNVSFPLSVMLGLVN
jgi:succinate dehydrogenase cytochrome b subunit